MTSPSVVPPGLRPRLLRTSTTPSTSVATIVARALSAGVSTKPFSCTMPRLTSTLISRAEVFGSAISAALTLPRITASSRCSPGDRWVRVAEQAAAPIRAETASAATKLCLMFMLASPPLLGLRRGRESLGSVLGGIQGLDRLVQASLPLVAGQGIAALDRDLVLALGFRHGDVHPGLLLGRGDVLAHFGRRFSSLFAGRQQRRAGNRDQGVSGAGGHVGSPPAPGGQKRNAPVSHSAFESSVPSKSNCSYSSRRLKVSKNVSPTPAVQVKSSPSSLAVVLPSG